MTSYREQGPVESDCPAEESPWANEPKRLPRTGRTFSCGEIAFALLVIAVLAVGGFVFWFMTSFSWTKGRPLRGRGRRRRGASSRERLDLEAQAAAHWRAMAQEEYESIASFSELGLDLMAAGAPIPLVTACHDAALEEAAHTETCLRLAESLDGRATECSSSRALRRHRGRPRWRSALLVRLAVESYVDGCLGEGSSARVLAKLSRRAREAGMRTSLQRLAREEMGHARLSTEVVRWCLAEGGAPVALTLSWLRRRYARALPETNGEAGTLREHGVPDDVLRGEALRKAFLWTEAVLK